MHVGSWESTREANDWHEAKNIFIVFLIQKYNKNIKDTCA